jgi:hypothetical protein
MRANEKRLFVRIRISLASVLLAALAVSCAAPGEDELSDPVVARESAESVADDAQSVDGDDDKGAGWEPRCCAFKTRDFSADRSEEVGVCWYLGERTRIAAQAMCTDGAAPPWFITTSSVMRNGKCTKFASCNNAPFRIIGK